MTISQGLNSRPAKDPRWRDDASCRSADVELFFPSGETGIEVDTIQAAKAVCRPCPVRDACLQFAVETRQTDGIWGGTTETERRRLRRAWLAARRAADPGQVTRALSSVPDSELERPVEDGPTRPSVRRPPWAGAEPAVSRPFITSEQDLGSIRSG